MRCGSSRLLPASAVVTLWRVSEEEADDYFYTEFFEAKFATPARPLSAHAPSTPSLHFLLGRTFFKGLPWCFLLLKNIYTRAP